MCPLGGAVAGLDGAALPGDNALGQGQADAKAVGRAGRAAVEPLKEVGQVLGVNPRPGIFHHQLTKEGIFPPTNGNRAPGGGVLHGIFDEVAHSFRRPVHISNKGAGTVHGEGLFPQLHGDEEGGGGLAHHLLQGDGV